MFMELASEAALHSTCQLFNDFRLLHFVREQQVRHVCPDILDVWFRDQVPLRLQDLYDIVLPLGVLQDAL